MRYPCFHTLAFCDGSPLAVMHDIAHLMVSIFNKGAKAHSWAIPQLLAALADPFDCTALVVLPIKRYLLGRQFVENSIGGHSCTCGKRYHGVR